MGKYAASKNQIKTLLHLFKTTKSDLKDLKNIIYGGTVSRQAFYKYKRSMELIKEAGLVNFGGDWVEITPKGRKFVDQILKEDISVNKENWDGLWRVVIYDVPDTMKNERNYFRKKLIEIGFKNLQESVWLIPYSCREELIAFAHSLGISPYVAILEANSIPNENRFKTIFNL